MLSWPKSLFSVFSVKCYGKKQTNLWTNTIDRYLPESKSDFITSTWDCSIQLSLCDPTDCSLLGFPVLHQLLELFLMPTESMMPSNHLILCRPFLLPPSLFPSIRVFSSESVLPFRRPKYWSFSFSISPSNEYSGLISFRMDWFDLLEVQGIWDCYLTTKSFILLSFKRVINIYTYIYISEDFCPAYKREPHMWKYFVNCAQ